jgi:uncharacterized Fe-S cluster-containing protein
MTVHEPLPGSPALPGLDCGMCGSRTCGELADRLRTQPGLIERCIPLAPSATLPAMGDPDVPDTYAPRAFVDHHSREFAFFLEHFPEDPGPREVILPRNPLVTRELDIRPGDVLIGRPLGMSCGCPITHCGTAIDVDQRTGVLTWCVSGPLGPRSSGFKDLGYYSAEAYEGIVTQTREEPQVGKRYFFQPRMCMLQWRHSGLVNYVNRIAGGWQVRLEGLWIG